MVSTPLKNISQNGNLPQIGVNKKNETTTQDIDILLFWQLELAACEID